jgi:glutamine---fructose-6-phosphate transaminase (isomerizing)
MVKIPTTKVMRLRGGRIEAREQPQAIATTLREEHANIKDIVDKLSGRQIEKIYLTGCGDSYYSGMAVQYALQQWLKIPCESIQALEYARYYHTFTDDNSLVLAQSHSGTTPRTYEAFMTAKQAGAFVIGVTNIPHTPLILETDAHILARATRVGWPTQATTAPMAAIYLLGLELAKAWGTLDNQEWQTYYDELFSLPDLVAQTLTRYDDEIRSIARQMTSVTDFFYVGGGPSLATANLGAAKVKEYSEDHAIVLELEEFHHYRSTKGGEPLFLVAPRGQGHDRAVDTAVRARKADSMLFALIEEGDDAIGASADYTFTFPPVSEALSPIPYVVPLHLFADHLSVAKGCLD